MSLLNVCEPALCIKQKPGFAWCGGTSCHQFWTPENILHQKDGQALEQAALGSGGVAIPGGI